jgi:uncharacterized BrkB/YihY/UPF0761 family membrane protein
MEQRHHPRHPGAAKRGGVVFALARHALVASGGMTATMAALDKCYELATLRAYHMRRPMAFALTIGMPCSRSASRCF